MIIKVLDYLGNEDVKVIITVNVGVGTCDLEDLKVIRVHRAHGVTCFFEDVAYMTEGNLKFKRIFFTFFKVELESGIAVSERCCLPLVDIVELAIICLVKGYFVVYVKTTCYVYTAEVGLLEARSNVIKTAFLAGEAVFNPLTYRLPLCTADSVHLRLSCMLRRGDGRRSVVYRVYSSVGNRIGKLSFDLNSLACRGCVTLLCVFLGYLGIALYALKREEFDGLYNHFISCRLKCKGMLTLGEYDFVRIYVISCRVVEGVIFPFGSLIEVRLDIVSVDIGLENEGAVLCNTKSVFCFGKCRFGIEHRGNPVLREREVSESLEGILAVDKARSFNGCRFLIAGRSVINSYSIFTGLFEIDLPGYRAVRRKEECFSVLAVIVLDDLNGSVGQFCIVIDRVNHNCTRCLGNPCVSGGIFGICKRIEKRLYFFNVVGHNLFRRLLGFVRNSRKAEAGNKHQK